MMNKSRLALPSAKELMLVESALADLDIRVSQSMSHIRDIQGWKKGELYNRFDNIKENIFKQYLQSSYVNMRPIHFVAAFSWVTMVPMTFVFNGLKIVEKERGMDIKSIEAIIRCGLLSKDHYHATLAYIRSFLSDQSKVAYDNFLHNVTKQYGSLSDFDDASFQPPKRLDIDDFADDYYMSIAFALREFREINNLSQEDMSIVSGLSMSRYKFLEDPSKKKKHRPYPLHIGIRFRLLLKHYSHVEFSAYMKKYPEFHTLRIVQHIRELLIVEALRHLDKKVKPTIISIMDSVISDPPHTVK